MARLAKREPTPGRLPAFRRLTRTEYQNAIRDLLGVQIDATRLLPKDEESHGFDNITVDTLSPSLLDRYLTAAQKISRLAVGTPLTRPDGFTFRLPADFTQEKHIEGLPVGTRGGVDLTAPRRVHAVRLQRSGQRGGRTATGSTGRRTHLLFEVAPALFLGLDERSALLVLRFDERSALLKRGFGLGLYLGGLLH